MAFEQEVYEQIASLEIFDGKSVSVTEDSVLFEVTNISAMEKFRAIGQAAFVSMSDEETVDYLDLTLILAKNVEQENVGKIIPKLYEVNLAYKQGVFFSDGGNNLCFETSFPVMNGKVDDATALFLSQYFAITEFLDAVYPDFLRVIVKPDESDFKEYLIAMAGKMGE